MEVSIPNVSDATSLPTGRGVKVVNLVTIRRVGVAIVMAVQAGAVQADAVSSGAYLGLGLTHGSTDIAFDTLSLSVSGQPRESDTPDGVLPHALVGYRYGLGGWVLGAEAEVEVATRDLSPDLGCAPGLNCAEAGVLGDLGPTVRLRLVAGRELATDTVLLGGVGLVAARVSSSRAYVTAGSAFDESSSFNRSSSPFEVDDLALGFTLGIGVEQHLSDRLSLRAEALYDRLHVETASSVYLLSEQTSLQNTSRAEFLQRGNFKAERMSLRFSLLMRF